MPSYAMQIIFGSVYAMVWPSYGMHGVDKFNLEKVQFNREKVQFNSIKFNREKKWNFLQRFYPGRQDGKLFDSGGGVQMQIGKTENAN